jgi:hypothetical protein
VDAHFAPATMVRGLSRAGDMEASIQTMREGAKNKFRTQYLFESAGDGGLALLWIASSYEIH